MKHYPVCLFETANLTVKSADRIILSRSLTSIFGNLLTNQISLGFIKSLFDGLTWKLEKFN